MAEYWKLSMSELKKQFQVSDQGLGQKQVEEIRRTTGENVLTEEKKQNIAVVFLHQFCDLLVVILLIAAVISLFSDSTGSSIVIIAVLCLNAVLGTVQHVKAQQSLESLKKLSSPMVKVIRDGRKQVIPSEELVPGDLTLLEAGDLIAADGRIIEGYALKVNESALTGESLNVEKTDQVLEGDLTLADRINLVYSGSLVTYGRAKVLVTGTGMQTEIGRIADLMSQTKERRTPLQVSLDHFSKRLAVAILGLSAVVFLLCIYRKMPVMDSMMFAVALAVAAIPEALGSIVTIVQAIGTRKMAEQNAIMKELKAVESLGCVSVICSDKTGTLTQNRMTVQKVFLGNHEYHNTVNDENRSDRKIYAQLLQNAVLNNDADYVEGNWIGDPTESALLELAADAGMDYKEQRQRYPREQELSFDSERKRMSIQTHLEQNQSICYTKGAVDILLERCCGVSTGDGVIPITDQIKTIIQEQNKIYSENGLRVLAFAYKETEEVLSEETEQNLVFQGLVAMSDPPREESMQAVKDAQQAGIRTIMITGDHKITASAIAKELGILRDGEIAITGAQLDQMSDRELSDQLEQISVYARVCPEHKLRIVNQWQAKGRIVAMTGDGVNDAPALKKADIGIAMGITGTEVSKDAAAMILSDDNFATIIQAVANGRSIYRNIKNAIQFLLSGNLAGILAVLFTSLVGLPVPFAAVHLLFMNLLTDSLPAIAIGMEPAGDELSKERPRDPSCSLLTPAFLKQMLFQGTLIAAATLTAYGLGLREGSGLASTMAFATLTMARLFHGFNCRGKESLRKLGLGTNRFSIAAFASGTCLLFLVLFLPVLEPVFCVTAMTLKSILTILLLAIIPTIVIQLVKIWRFD